MRHWQDDPFTKKARKENFLARSIYKLDEIDASTRIVAGAKRIVDLGAAPGSWVQYCLDRAPNSTIYAIDLQPLQISSPRVQFKECSIEDVDIPAWVGQKVDLVLSDMAPKTTGIVDADAALSFELASLALNTAEKCLKPGGHFVAKIFMGGEFELFCKRAKGLFQNTKVHRPEAVRKQSREVFLVGKGFKGPKS